MNSYGSPCVIVPSAQPWKRCAPLRRASKNPCGPREAARRFVRPTSRKKELIASHISPEICSRTERAFSRASRMHSATAFGFPSCQRSQSATSAAV
jgi:hypothetical protein